MSCHITELSFTVKYIHLLVLCRRLCLTRSELSLMMYPAPSPSLLCSAFVPTPFASSRRSSVPLTFVAEMCQSCLLPQLHALTLDHPHSTHCLFVFPLPPSSFSPVSRCVNSGLTGSCRAVWRFVRLPPRNRAALICFKVKRDQPVQRFARLFDPSMGPSALSGFWE